MNFYERVGKMAITSRLRRVSDLFAEDRRKIYQLYGFGLDPKWFPVFYVLSDASEGLSTKEIARQIDHSHASVSQIVKAMMCHDIVTTNKSMEDARVNVIALSQRGRELLPKVKEQYADVTEAVEELLAQAHSDLWHALGEIEFLLEERDLYRRVKQRYHARQQSRTRILDYRPNHQNAFRDLNLEWIERYFEVEATDRLSLDDPDHHVIEPGGVILMAEYGGKIVGTCALIKMDKHRFEIAKMAVSPLAQGKGIGWQLGRAMIERAREMGAKSLYLESNTVLEPAIALYRKLGFRRVTGPPSPYSRSNIQMELVLQSA